MLRKRWTHLSIGWVGHLRPAVFDELSLSIFSSNFGIAAPERRIRDRRCDTAAAAASRWLLCGTHHRQGHDPNAGLPGVAGAEWSLGGANIGIGRGGRVRSMQPSVVIERLLFAIGVSLLTGSVIQSVPT